MSSSRARLHSLSIASALRESLAEGYGRRELIADLIAGLTVGIIAIPLSMALAIASGVRPEYGLYTAIIAGVLIALTGGSRYSVSGPTAAFVVILYPISQTFGLAGLLVASVLSGMILIGLALARLGRLIEYIPQSVTLGFTSGIAIVIATLQLPDFLGFSAAGLPAHYIDKVVVLIERLPQSDWASLLVAVLTLATLILWPRLRLPVPGHLPALLVGTLVALVLNHQAPILPPSAAVSATCWMMARWGRGFRRCCRNSVGPGSMPVPQVPVLS